MPEFFTKNLSELSAKILQSKIALFLKKRHPRIFQFITKRLSLRRFQGLPLTILVIAIFSNLLLIADLTEDIINSKDSIAIDSFVVENLFKIRSEYFAEVLYYAGQICNIPSVVIIGFLICLYFLVKRKLHFALGILISLLGSGLTVFLGKSVFEIDRPHQYAYYAENYFSFPSGHATIAIAFYGLLFYFLGRGNKHFKNWIFIVIAAVFFFLLIGFSRLYLGVHYISDVAVGYLLGLLWLLLSVSVIEWQEHKQKN